MTAGIAFAVIAVPVAIVVHRNINLLAASSFDRPVPVGWGNPEPRGAFELIGDKRDFWVLDGSGWIRLPSPGVTRRVLIDSVPVGALDLTLAIRPDVPAAGNVYVYCLLDVTSNGENRAKIRLSPSGAVYTAITSREGTVESDLLPETRVQGLKSDRSLLVRCGSDGAESPMIRLKVWEAGTAEPLAWASQAPSSYHVAEGVVKVGLQAYASSQASTPLRIAFDDVLVHRLGDRVP
ncbi:MAG: hypothetical protein H0V73_11065 [Chloroflexi bacterium]|nr:hypothetical protein [Chloroflexota bacterium]